MPILSGRAALTNKKAWPSMVDFGGPTNAERYYDITFALTFPYAIVLRTNVADNAGSVFQYILNSSGGVPAIQLFLREASTGTNPNKLSANTNGSTNALVSSSSPDGDGVNRAIMLRGGSSYHDLHFCVEGGSAAIQGTSATAALSHTSATWYVGSNDGVDVDRFYGGKLASLVVIEVAAEGNLPTTAELETYATGVDPVTVWGSNVTHWWKFWSALTTVPDEVGSANATRHGTGW